MISDDAGSYGIAARKRTKSLFPEGFAIVAATSLRGTEKRFESWNPNQGSDAVLSYFHDITTNHFASDPVTLMRLAEISLLAKATVEIRISQ